MNHLYSIIFILLVTMVTLSLLTEEFNNYHLAQPTKCFSCERELPPGLKYLGGSTKCFSCERELAARAGMKYTDLAQPTKCFSCEAQMGPLLR